MSKNLTEVENAAMGAFGGWLDVTLFQWNNYVKNATQQGLPLTTDIRVLYRGYFANVCNNSIGIMFQFAINGALKKARPHTGLVPSFDPYLHADDHWRRGS